MDRKIYLDFNASTPIAPEALEAMRPFLTDHYGNPSSLHWAGVPAKDAVERARGQVAGILGGAPPGGGYGMVDPDDVRKAITPRTVLITVMHANNEVGTIEPIPEIAAIAREAGVPFHTDAAQTVGKIPTDVEELGVDLLSVAGHKVYAPKGIGALYIREGTRIEPFVHGAGHEAGRRGGGENVLLAVSLGAACEVATRWVGMPAVRALRDRFEQALRERLGDRLTVNGAGAGRLPHPADGD